MKRSSRREQQRNTRIFELEIKISMRSSAKELINWSQDLSFG